MKYQHIEAFMLMQYQDENDKTAPIEQVWNSRDGVTPFILRSQDGSCRMQHVNWDTDVLAVDYIPSIGQRAFVDLTEEKAREYLRRQVDGKWDVGGEFAMNKRWTTKDEAFEALLKGSLKDVEMNAPDVIVVDAEWQRRFLAAREERRRNRYPVKGGRFA